ncbi:MAG: hypothetical protein GY781_07310, partial [Gammaproteobacteria bacterium]|nr:hypothetical protein [Gammaproteobacteria bacterium]
GRFSFYGTLAVIFGFLATYDLGLEPGHTLLFTGVAILLIGYIHFFTFMRENQVHDANDEQQSQSEEEYRES